jgi:chromosomal replication initiator protein
MGEDQSTNMQMWKDSLINLRQELPAQAYDTWIAPLQVTVGEGNVFIGAPNAVTLRWVCQHHRIAISKVIRDQIGDGTNIVFGLVDQNLSFAEDWRQTMPPLQHQRQAVHASQKNQEGIAENVASIRSAVVDINRTSNPDMIGADNPNLSDTDITAGLNQLPEIGPNSCPGSKKPYGSLTRNYTLKRFVRGESNDMAWAGAKMVIDQCRDLRNASSPEANNPFFIYGATGVGKTHLMHAIGHALKDHYPEPSLVCCSSQEFVDAFVGGLYGKEHMQRKRAFKERFRNAEVLLIDDVQFFLDKPRSQEELMNTVDNLRTRGGQAVLTCDRLPKDLRDFETRLRSRFQGGLTVEIKAPDRKLRSKILQHRAGEQGINMSEEIAKYVATEINNHVRELEGALSTMILHAQSSRTELNMEMAKRVVRDMRGDSSRGLDINVIKSKVSEHYNVSVRDLESTSRSRSHVLPRHMAMKLIRELTPLSLPEIARAFGGRDHSAVIYGCTKVTERSLAEEDVRITYDRLLQELSA